MANAGSIVRKNLQDLSKPMELRELNRQLDWIWKKILGGLTSKDFSDAGIRSVVSVVEKTVAKTIEADEITTNVLKAALAEMMVAIIGVAKIDYAQIVDLHANSIFTDTGLAGKFRINGLEVTQAQIVDLIVSSFRLVSEDGKVYKVSVDENGELVTEFLEDQDEWFKDGKIPDGYSAIASSLTVGDVTAGRLYVSGAADIMKLTAKYLTADSAWIYELFAQEAFIHALTTSKILGGNSLEIIAGKTEDAARVFRSEDFPGPTVVVEADDLLVQPSTGLQYQAVKKGDIQFALDAEGNLYYSYDGSNSLSMQGFDLYADGFMLPVAEDGDIIGAPYEWVLVQDLQLREAIAAQAAEMAETVLTLNKDIANLQDQIDGNITTWFEDYIPTTSNAPANEWTTDDLKNQHLGDLFYVENTALEENGYCYRWQQTSGVYGWVLLEDSGVAKALAAAAKAQDTADSKRRVFYTTPVPPYDAGDLWVQGSGGDIMRCATSKSESQSYAAGDWVKASKYTDDSIANEALNKAIYDSATPPTTSPAAGKLWLDRSLVPPVLRRWKGLSVLPDDLDGWETVNDTATIEEAQAMLDAMQKQNETAIKELQTVVRVDTQGVHVGKAGNDNSEVLIENDRIRIVVCGKAYSTYAGDYMILGGDTELRRPASGGLAIGPV